MSQNQFISQSEIQAIEAAGHVASPAQVQALIREIGVLRQAVLDDSTPKTMSRIRVSIGNHHAEISIDNKEILFSRCPDSFVSARLEALFRKIVDLSIEKIESDNDFETFQFLPIEDSEFPTYVKIYLTRHSRQFRAEIITKGRANQEITVGGNSWNQGAFKALQPEIIRRCRSFAAGMMDNANSLKACE